MKNIKLFAEYNSILENTQFKETVYRGINIKPDANKVYGTEYSDEGIGTFWTDNITMAKWFAGMIDFDIDSGQYKEIKDNKGKLLEEKIKLNNPYIINSSHKDYNLERTEMDSFRIYLKEIRESEGVDNYKNYLTERGFDGIILKDNITNYYADGTYDIYITF